MQTNGAREHESPDALQAAFAVEFLQLDGRPPIMLLITQVEAWALLSQIQLASRHPKNLGSTREMAEQIARKLQAVVAREGALKIVAESGWDPAYDEAST